MASLCGEAPVEKIVLELTIRRVGKPKSPIPDLGVFHAEVEENFLVPWLETGKQVAEELNLDCVGIGQFAMGVLDHLHLQDLRFAPTSSYLAFDGSDQSDRTHRDKRDFLAVKIVE